MMSIGLFLIGVSLMGQARADSQTGAQDLSGGTPEPTAQVSHKKRKVKHASDKETDGTEAPNRFEADTVIQSQYQLHGEHLEVDPD
jgi:hypothetical protein